MDLNVGMTLDRAERFFGDGLKAVTEAKERGTALDYTEYAQANSPSGGEVVIQFSNEDMEDRPEMADKIIVDAD